MKLSIVGGAGEVGSTAAFELAKKNIFNEICLVDIRENIAKDHEMDMEQAVSLLSKTSITSGGFDKLAGSDIVLLAVGKVYTNPSEKHQGQVPSRMNFLKGNLEIIKSISKHIINYSPEAIIINATNPVDVMNSVIHQLTGIKREKIIGFSLNDTLRFRWAISKVLDLDINSIEALVLGEHGEAQCPVFSRVLIEGKKRNWSEEEKEKVKRIVDNFLVEKASLEGGRTSGWLSSVNLSYLIESMVKETGKVIPCSVIDDEGVSVGRAVILGKDGVKEVVDIELNEDENLQFKQAQNKISQMLTKV